MEREVPETSGVSLATGLASAGCTGVAFNSLLKLPAEREVCEEAGDPGTVGVSAFSVTEEEGTDEVV